MAYSKILVPTDFSDISRLAIDEASRIAERFGARLDVLHVWEAPPVVPEVMQLVTGETPVTVRDYVRGQAQKDMNALVDDLGRRGTVVHGRLEQGNAAALIAEIAAREHYDLIVMTTHARRGVERLFVGSVTEKVLRRAPCPLLVVPPHASP